MTNYKEQSIEVVPSQNAFSEKIFYVRINGTQQIDYARGRGDFTTEVAAENFAKTLIDNEDWD